VLKRQNTAERALPELLLLLLLSLDDMAAAAAKTAKMAYVVKWDYGFSEELANKHTSFNYSKPHSKIGMFCQVLSHCLRHCEPCFGEA
jgi:hypothetical protein